MSSAKDRDDDTRWALPIPPYAHLMVCLSFDVNFFEIPDNPAYYLPLILRFPATFCEIYETI